jgi:Flp pilus assembly pilin Flp
VSSRSQRSSSGALDGERHVHHHGGLMLNSLLPERASGQGLVEYGLIIALVAVLAIAGLVIFGETISSLLANVGGSV